MFRVGEIRGLRSRVGELLDLCVVVVVDVLDVGLSIGMGVLWGVVREDQG